MLDVIATFERVNGVSVPCRVVARRPGGVATCYASLEKAGSELGWQASLGLDEMVGSAWRFERMLNASNS